MAVLTGIDVLRRDGYRALAGRRFGLITNHTGVDATLTATADLLRTAGVGELVALFGPEHGIRGDAAEGEHVASGQDALTGLPVHSLYGDGYEPRAEWLADLDAVVFDIQDIGARFYTYIQTMATSMAVAGRLGVEYIVLDRPNPLGGLIVEGTVVEPGFSSFVGLHPLATRHGLTAGEIARFYIATGWVAPAPRLTVITMEGWQRSMYYEETGLPWVPPSPAATTPEMAVCYPGTCLFEGTNVSEGRGTTRPFEIIGAPFIDGWALRGAVGPLPGALLRPHFFRPTASKHAGLSCGGVQIHVTDRHAFRPYETALRLFAALLRLYPHDIRFTGEYPGNYFDLLQGTDRVRRGLLADKPVERILTELAPSLAAFGERRAEVLLYE
jgi:uncharacterized protein YbbC (DUF1343 family)